MSFSRDRVWHELLEGRWDQYCIFEHRGGYKEMICISLGLILPSKALKLEKVGGSSLQEVYLQQHWSNGSPGKEGEHKAALTQQNRLWSPAAASSSAWAAAGLAVGLPIHTHTSASWFKGICPVRRALYGCYSPSVLTSRQSRTGCHCSLWPLLYQLPPQPLKRCGISRAHIGSALHPN